MLIVGLIFTGIGWLMAAILYEAGYQALKNGGGMTMHKSQACHIWWVVLGGLSLAAGPTAFLINLPLILAIGMSHVDLAKQKEDVISVAEILKNIPAALREAAGKIRHFIKQNIKLMINFLFKFT